MCSLIKENYSVVVSNIGYSNSVKYATNMNTMSVNDRNHLIIAVIPAYNEERSIAKVILLTKKYVDMVIVGDDGSNDMTSEIAKALGAVVIRNDKNKGKGYTLRRLFNEALKLGADIVVALDADGQHNPDYIPKLVEPIIKGQADMVIGSRCQGIPPDRMPSYRKIGLKIIELIHKPAIKSVKDTQSGYRAYRREVVKILVKEMRINGYGTETEQLFIARKYNWQVIEVPVSITYTTENSSKKHPLKHGMEIVKELLRLVTEERPLLTLGVPGALLIVVGLSAAMYVIWVFNLTRYFSIPVTLISITFIFTGLLLEIASLVLYALSNIRRALLEEFRQ